MLTLQNYYNQDNRSLTRSQIMDYLLCPNYFYRKDIIHEVEKKSKEAFTIGRAVDDLLAQIDNIANYAVLEIPDGEKDTYWLTKAGKEYKKSLVDAGKTVVSKPQYDQIISISDAVEKTSTYKSLKDFEKQRVLSVDWKIGEHFDYLSGLPDFIKEYDDKIVIVDLKTSQTIEPRKYYWHCRSYGYFLQAALYTYLAKKTIADKPVEFYHLVAEKQEPYRVETFRIPNRVIEEYTEILLATIDEIANDKEFKKKDCSLEMARNLDIVNVEDEVEFSDN